MMAGRDIKQKLFHVGVMALVGVFAATSNAQQLEPRAYWPAPTGTNVLAVSYQHTSGDIIVDQSLPVTGVDSSFDYLQLSYQHFLDIAGRTASISVAQTWADGQTTGVFNDEDFVRKTSGPLDTTVRASINLLGAQAMSSADFRDLRTLPRPILGASLSVSAPTGSYDPEKVINLGSNRWAFKPGIGGIYPLTSQWLLEGAIDIWFFQDNDDFLGKTRQQDPIGQFQAHLVRRFTPGFWASVDANWYVGGRTTVDGDGNKDLQRNSRLGVTLVYPLEGGQALRLAASTGAVTETGGEYNLVSLTWFRLF